MTASGLLSAADVMMATGRMTVAELSPTNGYIVFADGQKDPWALSSWDALDFGTRSLSGPNAFHPGDIWLLNNAWTSTQSWIASSAWLPHDMWSPKVQWVLETPERSYYFENFITFGGGSAIFFLCAAFLLYFLPFFIAMGRNHRNKGAIFILNVLLGFTFVGWVAALVWSLTAQHRPVPQPDRPPHHNPPPYAPEHGLDGAYRMVAAQ